MEQIAQLLDRLVSAAELRQAEIVQRISVEQATLARVAARLRQIEHEGTVSPYEVARKAMSAQTIATIRQIVPDLAAMTPYRCSMYDALYAWLAHHHINPTGHELALYHTAEFVDLDIDMELGVVPASAAGQDTGRVTIHVAGSASAGLCHAPR